MRTVQFQWGCALALAVALCGGTWPSYGKDAMNHKNQQVVRRTQGDGRWFPGDKATLSKMINEYVGAAQGRGAGYGGYSRTQSSRRVPRCRAHGWRCHPLSAGGDGARQGCGGAVDEQPALDLPGLYAA